MQPLPKTGMTLEKLREITELCVAKSQPITLDPVDLLAILVTIELRESLDGAVRRVATFALSRADDGETHEAARQVLAHRASLPPVAGVG